MAVPNVAMCFDNYKKMFAEGQIGARNRMFLFGGQKIV